MNEISQSDYNDIIVHNVPNIDDSVEATKREFYLRSEINPKSTPTHSSRPFGNGQHGDSNRQANKGEDGDGSRGGQDGNKPIRSKLQPPRPYEEPLEINWERTLSVRENG